MQEKPTIIIAHGYTSSPKKDWHPSIKKLLEGRGIRCIIPALPGGEHPHAKVWLEKLHEEISEVSGPIVLLGHSLGSRAVLLYLEEFQPQVQMVMLIAALANRIENRRRKSGNYADFFEHAINLEKVRSCSPEFVVLHSQDDSSIPFEQGKEIASDLGARLITLSGLDHMSEQENAPVIFDILINDLGF